MKTDLLKLKFILAFIALSFAMYSQTPSWQWARGAGSTGSEEALGTALDASGNLYVIGWYTSANITFGAITLTNPGNFTSDIFLVKYDPLGNAIWAKTFGNVDGDLGSAVEVDKNGNIYITGWFASSAISFDTYTLTNTSVGSSDAFVVKLNSSGAALWAQKIGGTLGDRGTDITVDKQSNIFVTGGFNSSLMTLGTQTITNAGASDVFITKLNGSGNFLWAKSVGGTGADIANSVACDSLGNVCIVGSFASSSINFGTGVLTNASAGTQDVFVAKYSSVGNALWSIRTGGSSDDYAKCIAIRNGNAYVAGGFVSPSISLGTNVLSNASSGTSDIFLTKIDNAGSVVWAKRAGGNDAEEANGIACDSLNKIYLTGGFSSSSALFDAVTVSNSSVGYKDVFVAAYDDIATVLWVIKAGDIYDEGGITISVSPSSSMVYIGGFFNSPSVPFGTSTVTKGCGDDVFVAKLLAPSVGISELESKESILVYPNPSNGKLIVEAEGQIILYNNLGQAVKNEKLIKDEQLDFSSLPKGIYTIKIISKDKKTSTAKIILE